MRREDALAQLDTFTGTVDDDSTVWCRVPLLVVVSGTPWTVATDRTCLVAIRGHNAITRMTDTDRVARLGELIGSNPPSDAKVTSGELLREWAGEVPTDWDKKDKDQQRSAVLHDILIDQNRLAHLLSGAPPGDVTVWDAGAKFGKSSLGLQVGAWWRGFLGRLEGDPEADDEHYSFAGPPDAGFSLMAELDQE